MTMIAVVEPGLETAVQDYPGRVGWWGQGIPPSGPMDARSFRLANLLVGNDLHAAGLEAQFVGPTLRFSEDTVFAITGADMSPTLDGDPVPMWQTMIGRAGQTLKLSFTKSGARAYVAFSGGIDLPPVLGSRSTFHKAGIGGLDGRALLAGDALTMFPAAAAVRKRLRPDDIPQFPREWVVEVMAGPHDDWLDEPATQRFLEHPWRLSPKSDRTGARLEGPEFTFSRKAYDKPPENGSDPANIVDAGYPIGAVNLAGQTPIVLLQDGPSLGGFINPFTVISAALWTFGQGRPGDVFHFRKVSMEEAGEIRSRFEASSSEVVLESL